MSTIKKILFLLIFSSCFFSITAQVGLGVKAGVISAQQSITNIDLNFDSDEITGSSWGIFLEFPLGEGVLAIQPEFLVLQKGGQFSLPDVKKITLDYIAVPLLLKLRLLNSNLIDIHLLGGPSFGYARDGEQLENNTVVKIDFGNDNIKRFDVGMHGGATAEIQLGSLRAFGDIRYLFGLSDVDGTDSRTVNNKGLAFSAGFIFKLFGQQY